MARDRKTTSYASPDSRREIESFLLHSWASYMEYEGGVKGKSKTRSNLDYAEFFKIGSDSMFSTSGSLVETLESGFGGRTDSFKILQWIHAERTDTEAYLAQSEDKSKLVLSIRGSESLRDWAMNAQTFQTRWEPKLDSAGNAGCFAMCDSCCRNNEGKPMVHLGFYKAFLQLKHTVEDTMVEICKQGDVKEVIFCGHSLGGAVSNLCFAHFMMIPFGLQLLIRGIKITLGTIGAPRVGNIVFCELLAKKKKLFEDQGEIRVYRVTNNNDMIPCVPAHSAGYHHFGRPVIFKINNIETGDIVVNEELESVDYDEGEDDSMLLTKAHISDGLKISKMETNSVLPKGFDYSELFDALDYHLPRIYSECAQKANVQVIGGGGEVMDR